MKLNMWYRLGIVISVLWILGDGLWVRTSDIGKASSVAEFTAKVCIEAEDARYEATKKEPDLLKCEAEADKDFRLYLEGSWGNVAIGAFGPLLLGWLAVFIVLWVTRWMLAGRKVSG
ncbi:hypothetical protein LGH82_17510 [Mesorhizobium sp. PAMC28654]|uniref:hypothetical protein n=1 Tax=Mesorhizobium sp. PAMC28654 TaxID=2880934 RepID=UPI001D09A21D|nr:hypothetical protein [Mesorhizobium sp. PAMC28654]UDL87016.1 hypothetical protein LGH82_17510 [Mesorhizobium sp. PAMC28654]